VPQPEPGFLLVTLEHKRERDIIAINYPTKWRKVPEKLIAYLVKKFLPFMEPEVS
jgi:hypothetical protein